MPRNQFTVLAALAKDHIRRSLVAQLLRRKALDLARIEANGARGIKIKYDIALVGLFHIRSGARARAKFGPDGSGIDILGLPVVRHACKNRRAT